MSGKIRAYRMDIGIKILLEMKKNNEFPIQNKRRLATRMMEYFYQMGLEEKVYKVDKYSWIPDVEYWMFNLTGTKYEKPLSSGKSETIEYEGLQQILRKQGQFFCFMHSGKAFEGEWKFTSKEEYVSEMERNHGELNTRIETYNDKVTDAQSKWKNVQLPHAQPVPALT